MPRLIAIIEAAELGGEYQCYAKIEGELHRWFAHALRRLFKECSSHMHKSKSSPRA
jgi:hypothetical protein